MRTSSGVSFRLRRRCGLYVAAAVLGLGVLLVGIPVRAGDGSTERVRCHCCRVQVKSKAAIQAGKGTEASREQRRKSRSRVEVLASRLDKKQVEDGRMHVVVIDRADMRRMGAQTAAQVFSRMPAGRDRLLDQQLLG
jgi:hypothetical protein